MFKQVFRGPLSETGSVASRLGQPGEVRYDSLGNAYRLVYFNESCAHGDAVQFDTATSNVGYQVIQANGAIPACGVFNQCGTAGTITTGYYGWVQYKGTGVVSVTASDFAANLYLIPSNNGALHTAAIASSGTADSDTTASWYWSALPYICGSTISSLADSTLLATVWIDMM